MPALSPHMGEGTDSDDDSHITDFIFYLFLSTAKDPIPDQGLDLTEGYTEEVAGQVSEGEDSF